MRVRVDLREAKFRDVLMIYHGRFIEPEEFEKVFENASDVFKFFDNSIILGAVIDSRDRKVYFITLSTDQPYTTLTIWTAKIE
jgi:hypothetical protein